MPADADVSIPFRADTGFEHGIEIDLSGLSLQFQSLSGLTLGLNRQQRTKLLVRTTMFQSLSGLTLGLNPTVQVPNPLTADFCFNPFQG